MSKFFERLFAAEGDSTIQVTDLILFLGYFSICLYGGGIAYQSSYNQAFQLQVTPSFRDPSVAVAFVTNVLLKRWYWIPASLYALLFIFTFYSSRYVWRLWFGYFLLSFLLYCTFLVCGCMGKTIGNADATRDKSAEKTSKPVVKLTGNIGLDLTRGDYRLLAEDKIWFFVFQPVENPASVLQVHAVLKSEVKRYEIIIQ